MVFALHITVAYHIGMKPGVRNVAMYRQNMKKAFSYFIFKKYLNSTICINTCTLLYGRDILSCLS